VLVSTMTWPLLVQSSRPPSASASSRTTSPDGRERKITLEPSTASRSWPHAWAPWAPMRSSGAGSRSYAMTRAPDFCTSLRHIGSPMMPSPMNPSCVVSAAILLSSWLVSARRDVDRLRLLVQAHAADPLLSAEPAVLEAAERRRDRQLLVGVDPDRAGGQSARDPPGTSEIPGPDAGGQAIDAVVGLGDQVGFIVEGQRAQHRAEDFLAHDRVGRIGRREHGGQVERAGGEPCVVGPPAATEHLHAALAREPDHGFDAFAMPERSDRAHLRARGIGHVDPQRARPL